MTGATGTGAVLSRREATRLLVLVPAAAAAAPLGATERDGAGQLRAFMKLQSRADDGYTDYVNRGAVYAAIPGRQSVPMYGYEGLLRFRTRIAGPDLYEVTFIEAGTYLDLETGQRIDRYRNPLTGAEDTVDHIVEGPMTWRWTTEALAVADPMPGLHRRVAWQRFGTRSWLHFDNIVSMPLPGGATLHAAALATYVGSTAELNDPGRSSVSDTVLVDSSINPWAPWLRMGDAPGRLVNNITGRKLGAMSEAPERLLKFIAATQPAVLKDAAGWTPPR